MENETWEMSSLDWSKDAAAGMTVTPSDVRDLIFSSTKEQARKAYFTVEEAVGLNGSIFPCALAVVKTVLAALPQCGVDARYECLELMAMIAGSESASDAGSVVDDCMLEIRNATWYFLYGLQFDDIELVSSYVDILGCLGLKFEDLRPTVERYLQLVLTRDLRKIDFEMVTNTIVDIRAQAQR